MANIVPSDNKSVLAYQLYFLRAVLGELYLEATAVKQRFVNLEPLQNTYKSMQATMCYLEGAVIKEYHTKYSPSAKKKQKHSENVYKSKNGLYIAARVASIVIPILIAVVGVGALLIFAFEYWYSAIPVGVVAISIAIALSDAIKNKFKPNKQDDDVIMQELEKYDKYFPMTLQFVKGEKRPEDYKEDELTQYNEWLEKVVKAQQVRFDNFVRENPEHMQSYKDSQTFVNRYYVLSEKIKAVKEKLQKHEKQYSVKLASYQKKKTYVATQFFDFLIEDDWHMVDDLIYMVVSGRAKTMQEALNYGDLKLRHEETIGAIKTVSRILNEQVVLQNKILCGMSEVLSGIYALNDTMCATENRLSNIERVLEQSAESINSTIKRSSQEMIYEMREIG